jgi:hypothetical protein
MKFDHLSDLPDGIMMSLRMKMKKAKNGNLIPHVMPAKIFTSNGSK